MLEYSKLPAKQGRPAQKQQLYTAPAAYGVSRTNIRSNFRSDLDERYHPVQCIPQQSLFYGADISWSSDNAAAAPIQMLTIISNGGAEIRFDNLEQYVNHFDQNPELKSPDFHFCRRIKELRKLMDIKNISIADVQYNKDNTNETFREILDLVRSYYVDGSDPWENIKRLAESYSDCFPTYNKDVKVFLNKINSTFGKSKFVNEMVSKFLNQKAASLEWYLQFGQAVAHHAEISRVDHGSDIDPNDIKDTFDKSTACVISALMYAEGSIFGTDIVEEFHHKLTRYFNTYPGYTKEQNDNVKNNVWKNYSDDNVYPSMYAFFGYDKRDLHDPLINVYHAPDNYALEGKRGIIIVPGHAIGFRYVGNGTITLCDNESKDSKQIFNSHQNKVVSAIYAKQL